MVGVQGLRLGEHWEINMGGKRTGTRNVQGWRKGKEDS